MGGTGVREVDVLDVEHLVGGIDGLVAKLETTDLLA